MEINRLNVPVEKVSMVDFSNMKYFRVQTNRVSIKKILLRFQTISEKEEFVIAPRPLPHTILKFYYALLCVKPQGGNIRYIQKFKNCKEISRQEFEREKADIKYFWSSEKERKNLDYSIEQEGAKVRESSI